MRRGAAGREAQATAGAETKEMRAFGPHLQVMADTKRRPALGKPGAASGRDGRARRRVTLPNGLDP